MYPNHKQQLCGLYRQSTGRRQVNVVNLFTDFELSWSPYFSTKVSTFRDSSQKIGIASRDWRIGFPHVLQLLRPLSAQADCGNACSHLMRFVLPSVWSSPKKQTWMLFVLQEVIVPLYICITVTLQCRCAVSAPLNHSAQFRSLVPAHNVVSTSSHCKSCAQCGTARASLQAISLSHMQ
jgi:hypothetical protein